MHGRIVMEFGETLERTRSTIALYRFFVLVQERNSKYPNGGPESSRLTATARRRLGSLKSLIDTLQAQLESDACSSVYVCDVHIVLSLSSLNLYHDVGLRMRRIDGGIFCWH